MTTREALNGEIAEVGDMVVCFYCGSEIWRKPLTRVTPKRAYMRCNDIAEMVFPRQYNGFHWKRLGHADRGATFRLHKEQQQ